MKFSIPLKGFYTSFKYFFSDWANRCNKSLSFLFAMLICVHIVSWFIKDSDSGIGLYCKFLIAMLAIFIPFLALVIIFTSNKAYGFLSNRVWFRIAMSIIFLAYGLVANVWASNYINQIYGVSASHFPVTQIVLTVVFFVVYIMKVVFELLYVAIIVSSAFLAILLLMPDKTLGAFLWTFIKFLFAAITISSTYYFIANIEGSLRDYTQYIASNSDFYSYSYCVQDQGENSKYIFIGSGKMLVMNTDVTVSPPFIYTVIECGQEK